MTRQSRKITTKRKTNKKLHIFFFIYIFFNKSNNIVSKAGARGRGINSWDNQILEVENVIYINRSLYWGYFGSYMILGGKTGKT